MNGPDGSIDGVNSDVAGGNAALAEQEQQRALAPPTDYDRSIDAVKQVITDNPKVAATVVKNWVGDE